MTFSRISLAIIIGFVLFISLRTLTSQPRYFADEAIVVETANNLAFHGTADVMVSPDVFSGYSHLFTATGYSVSLPLAAIFKFTGVNFMYARLMMTIWLVIVVLSIFYITKSFWNKEAALAASSLMASFAPFYGNGMQIMGEIPGLVFLLWGLYQLFQKQNYLLTGLFFGLAAISKPSIYILILPVFLIHLWIFEKDKIQKSTNFGLGFAGPLILYFVLIVPDIFSPKYWVEIISLYRNPFDSSSQLHNIISNIKTYWSHSTIVYFAVLIFVIASFFRKYIRSYEQKFKELYIFIFIYFVFLITYFLRSPGWFRYLAPLEFLTLVIFYPVISLKKKRLGSLAVSFLVLLQVVQLFFFRGDHKEAFAQETAAYINSLGKSVGIINAPEVSSLITLKQRYQVAKYAGVPQMGINPLLYEGAARTEFIVFKSADNPLVVPYQARLETNYKPLNQIGSFRIYQLKPIQ